MEIYNEKEGAMGRIRNKLMPSSLLVFSLFLSLSLSADDHLSWASKNAKCEKSFQSNHVKNSRDSFFEIDIYGEPVDFMNLYKESVEPVLTKKGFSVSNAIYLGGGAYGNVFLVSVGKKIFAVKHYVDGDGMKSDISSFSFLRELISEFSIDIKIPQFYRLDYDNLLLEYVPGDTIHNIYKSAKSVESLEEKNRVKALSEVMYKKLEKALKTYPYLGNFKGAKEKNFIRLPNRRSTQLFLHEKNIIYNKEANEFWVIDPF